MIPQIQPFIGEEELREVTEVIKSNWVTEGKKTKIFEEKIADLCDVKHAIAVSNGTIALYMALKVIGISEGDEVLVPDLTFIASSNSVLMAGGKPVFVDVDKKTFNINPDEIESNITDKTKAIMPVHLYGTAADMDEICRIAKKNDLYIIEDAAQGIGVKFRGKHVGSFGEMGCLSFYGNKTITTGEGGVILTNDDEFAVECYKLKNHGRKVKGIFIHDDIGYNFSYTDLQAALGIAQLSKLDMIISRKREIYNMYRKELIALNKVSFPYLDPMCSPVFWFTNILVSDASALKDYLAEQGIETRRFFYPLHMQPCYNYNNVKDFPNAVNAYEHGLSLPSYVSLRDSDIIFVCNKIKEYYRD